MTTFLIIASLFLLTAFIECGVLCMMGENTRRVLLSSVAVNFLTNVPLNLWLLFGVTGLKELLVAEGLIVIIEALWYYIVAKLPVRRASACSLLCNAISFLTGVTIQTTYYLLTQ